MTTRTVQLASDIYELAAARAVEAGATVDALVGEFLNLYTSIENAGCRQVFMQWLRHDAKSAQDERALNAGSRVHVYR